MLIEKLTFDQSSQQYQNYYNCSVIILYLYQCYVTDPWWQCDPVRVYKGVKIPWNPECQTITVSTDSEAGSGETVRVYFYDTDGAAAGGLSILVSTEIHFRIGFCSTAFTPFPAALLPTETEKTWTITYNYRYKRVVFHCNGVQVFNVVLYSECDNSDYGETWTDYWGSKPTQIQFHSSDSASDTYCFSSNPGKYNGVIDSGE